MGADTISPTTKASAFAPTSTIAAGAIPTATQSSFSTVPPSHTAAAHTATAVLTSTMSRRLHKSADIRRPRPLLLPA